MNTYLLKELSLHKQLEPQDVIKFLYQSLYGPEHLIGPDDRDAVFSYFLKEYDDAVPKDSKLVTQLSEKYSRIDIGAYKRLGLDPVHFFNMFYLSAGKAQAGKDAIISCIDEIKKDFDVYGFAFSHDQFDEYCRSYVSSGMGAVHHSSSYRDLYRPSYRLVDNRYLPVLTVLSQVRDRKGTKLYIIAVDGRCGSGKSTLSSDISAVTGASVIHMDDFYVPIKLRTSERYSVPGRNVHLERIKQEVIPEMMKGDSFSYRLFDHSTMDIGDRTRSVPANDLYVVEGAYSQNPELGMYYDLSVFYDIDPELQIERIAKRNPDKVVDFKTRWIPLEEEYLKFYSIRDKADIILHAGQLDIDL